MPSVTTPEPLAARICHALDLPAKEHAERLDLILRPAMGDVRKAAVLATRTRCLEIAEDEAERCRGVGATAAQQTALNIAARIRNSHVEVTA
jgi:hypothetical protein